MLRALTVDSAALIYYVHGGAAAIKKLGKTMSNVLDKAVEVAQRRAAWEAKINPEGQMAIGRALTEKEQTESQKLIDEFKDAVVKACAKPGLDTLAGANAALDKLDYDAEYVPLWKMSTICIPVTESTMALAKTIAPTRVGTIELAREGKFGVYVPESDGSLVHRASDRPAPRGEAAKQAESRGRAEQAEAFREISSVVSVAIKGAPAGKKVEEALRSLDKLGGTRVVDGEKKVVPAIGQMSMFDAETAPIPADAKSRTKRFSSASKAKVKPNVPKAKGAQ